MRGSEFPYRNAGVDMNENILIVDDEKEIADLIEVYLKNDGYTVLQWHGCFEMYRRNRA